jgi:hypothetical protein
LWHGDRYYSAGAHEGSGLLLSPETLVSRVFAVEFERMASGLRSIGKFKQAILRPHYITSTNLTLAEFGLHNRPTGDFVTRRERRLRCQVRTASRFNKIDRACRPSNAWLGFIARKTARDSFSESLFVISSYHRP